MDDFWTWGVDLYADLVPFSKLVAPVDDWLFGFLSTKWFFLNTFAILLEHFACLDIFATDFSKSAPAPHRAWYRPSFSALADRFWNISIRLSKVDSCFIPKSGTVITFHWTPQRPWPFWCVCVCGIIFQRSRLSRDVQLDQPLTSHTNTTTWVGDVFLHHLRSYFVFDFLILHRSNHRLRQVTIFHPWPEQGSS